MYLTYKALHLIAMVAWFAALFYLPRLFVYHTKAAAHPKSNALLKTMSYKLYTYIATPAMIATWVFGLLLLHEVPELLAHTLWMPFKLACVVALTAYHFSLNRYRKAFEANINLKTETFFRWYNEIPTLFLIIIILVAVFKPF